MSMTLTTCVHLNIYITLSNLIRDLDIICHPPTWSIHVICPSYSLDFLTNPFTSIKYLQIIYHLPFELYTLFVLRTPETSIPILSLPPKTFHLPSSYLIHLCHVSHFLLRFLCWSLHPTKNIYIIYHPLTWTIHIICLISTWDFYTTFTIDTHIHHRPPHHVSSLHLSYPPYLSIPHPLEISIPIPSHPLEIFTYSIILLLELCFTYPTST